MEYQVFTHATIKIKSNNKIIYFDPFQIKEKDRADYIFITHDHYDHYDEESIKKIMTPSTKIIIPQILEEQVKKITSNYLLVTPNNQYLVDEIKITSVPSYNINKPFHPKEKEYVGYILILENKKIYVMGDTDRTSELDNIKTDICFVPIGGTYTMNYQEAATYINYIKPKIVVPIHYGSIVGDISLKDDFESLIEKNIEVKTFIK